MKALDSIRLLVTALLGALLFAACPGSAAPEFTGEAQAPAEPLSLWYRQPAKAWTEALAIGNGRLGAMVFGRVSQEILNSMKIRFGAAAR